MPAYINPGASGRRLIYISHTSCVIYAIVMASFSTGLYYAGVSMGYLYLMMVNRSVSLQLHYHVTDMQTGRDNFWGGHPCFLIVDIRPPVLGRGDFHASPSPGMLAYRLARHR